jgi:hypothetical protein
MQRKWLLTVIALVASLIVLGTVGSWFYYEELGNPNPTPTPTASPETSTQEQVRDAAVTYIKDNHADAAEKLTDLAWTGGRATSEGLVGSETYNYTSGDWTLTLQYPVVPDPIYTIKATYTSGTTSINWQGTSQSGSITETSYTAIT